MFFAVIHQMMEMKNIMKSFFKYIFVVLISVQTFNSYAWNALGHMVVANIAYERLQPSVRIKIDKMVVDLAKEYPEINEFNQIAPWPDSIRSQKIETFTHWHYINLAFSEDGTPLKNISDADNVVWAVKQIEPIISNSKANPYERARFLAFLVHIVGDIHQPLHTVGRISATNPEGDHGGNLYFVKYPLKNPLKNPQSMTLHKLWDQGIDLFSNDTSSSNIASLSNLITSLYPEKYFGSKVDDLTPENWADEGLAISQAFVYSTPEEQVPNENYSAKGKEVIEERIALSAYRLANLLNDLLA